jgi:colanic acid/amylovoran biosynthesis protein
MQFSRRFCEDERVKSIPMDLYYNWRDNELELAKEELIISEQYKVTGELTHSTPYIQQVLNSQLIIDFSGDIWGDNANFLGKDRFEVGLLKDKIAQNLGKKVVMLAGSPGPFTNELTKNLAKEVYAGFDLVTNREAISASLLVEEGFDLTNTHSLACPAFMFEPATGKKISNFIRDEIKDNVNNKGVIGFILCGWNFETGPFDKWPRNDEDYIKFAELIEHLTKTLGLRVCLMSHSNGFDVPVVDFKLKHGRDYLVIKQLEKVIKARGIAKDFFCIEQVLNTWETKAVIGSFDMLVSGRIHAAVSGLSQSIPTVIIDYGHEPKAHKLLGFASVAEAQHHVADPANLNDLKDKVDYCWNNRELVKNLLDSRIPKVKQLAKENFSLLKGVI